MTHLPITSLLTAVLAVGLVALSFPVTLRRVAVGVLVGDGPDEILRRRVRAQGNFIEYVPLATLAIGLLEEQGAPSWVLLSVAGAFVGGRALHAVGMLGDSAALRGVGMLLNYVSLVWSAGYLMCTVGAIVTSAQW